HLVDAGDEEVVLVLRPLLAHVRQAIQVDLLTHRTRRRRCRLFCHAQTSRLRRVGTLREGMPAARRIKPPDCILAFVKPAPLPVEPVLPALAEALDRSAAA